MADYGVGLFFGKKRCFICRTLLILDRALDMYKAENEAKRGEDLFPQLDAHVVDAPQHVVGQGVGYFEEVGAGLADADAACGE